MLLALGKTFHHVRILPVVLHFPFLKHLHTHPLPSSPASKPLPKCNSPPDLLSLCTSVQYLNQLKQAHSIFTLHGLLPRSITICAALILQYATFQANPSTIYHLFYQTLPFSPSSTFLNNTMIRAHFILGLYREGLVIYNEMVKNEVKCDDYTYPFVLKLCSECCEVWKGLEVHCSLTKVGFDKDLFVNNTLMLFYGSCGDLKDVEKMFVEMPIRDVVSWNTVIRALSDTNHHCEVINLFNEMVSFANFKPNDASLVSVLPVCATIGNGITVRGIHCYSLKVGLDNKVRVGNAFVDAYGKCGEFQAAMQVFDEMVEKNDVSWNAIITSFAYRGCFRDALDSFKLMINERIKLNSVAVSSLLPVLGELGFLSMGREVHGLSVRMGIDADIFVTNSLIDFYAKSGRPVDASHVFYNMSSRNVVSWNTMVANLAQNELESEAIEFVRKMQVHGEIPNGVTFTNVLPACARICSLQSGKEIHARLIREGSASDLFVSNALTDMYAKCGCLKQAQCVFDISPTDEVSYNILIVGYSQTHECSKSLLLFSDMGLLGMKHDSVSFMGVLSACANISAIKQGKEIHGFAIRRSFHEQLFVANSLLDMYTKSGRIDLAKKIFDRIPNKDCASCNTMILGFGMLGELDTAIDLFEAMKEDGIDYDSVSYVAVLSACSHGGLVEKARRFFNDMLDCGIKPSQLHYACMVDLLSRSGLIEEAIDLIKGLPVTPDANIWGALLGGCRLHGNVELGCWAAEHLLKLKPDHSGYYALLSNMYAEAGKWVEADRVRELMKLRGVKKNPGCSWVQNQDQTYTFMAGERLEG